MMNHTNTHAFMRAAVNAKFKYINKNKEIKLFCEIEIEKMIKQFKQLDEGSIPGNIVVITLNHN